MARFRYNLPAVKIVYLWLLFCTPAGPVLAETARPTTYGFSPAIPLSTQLPEFDARVPMAVNERKFEIVLEISEKGEVKSAGSEHPADSMFAAYVFSSLKKITFEPALKEGLKISSKLPIRFSHNPRYRISKVYYPVDSMHNVSSNYLYDRALELNGVTLPEVKKFPSYFFKVTRKDSLEILPYVLFKIELDENAQLKNCEVFRTNTTAHTEQLKSAALWGEYSPLEINGQAVGGVCYLLINFLPQLQYPTKPVNFESDSTINWYDHWRVRILPDTLGLINPALPTVQKIEELPLLGTEKFQFAELVASMVIDSSGRITIGLTDTKQAELNKIARSLFKNTRFFPAADFTGKTVGFSGSAKISLTSRANARIEYLWLAN